MALRRFVPTTTQAATITRAVEVARRPDGRLDPMALLAALAPGRRPFRVTHDPTYDVGYLYLREIAPGEAKAFLLDDDVILDFTIAGEVLGVEVLAMRALLPPEILASADPPGPA